MIVRFADLRADRVNYFIGIRYPDWHFPGLLRKKNCYCRISSSLRLGFPLAVFCFFFLFFAIVTVFVVFHDVCVMTFV